MCVFYAVFAAISAVIMVWLAVAFTVKHWEGDFFAPGRSFVDEALSNQAGQFIYADLVLVWAALSVYMVVEGRRVGIRHVWAYIVGAPALALTVSFPLFMLVRQLKIADPSVGDERGSLRVPAE